MKTFNRKELENLIKTIMDSDDAKKLLEGKDKHHVGVQGNFDELEWVIDYVNMWGEGTNYTKVGDVKVLLDESKVIVKSYSHHYESLLGRIAQDLETATGYKTELICGLRMAIF